jgi:hypothetical protein
MAQDISLLRAALIGDELQLAKLRSDAAALQKKIGSGRGGGDMPGPFVRKRRQLSAAARKRIAAAQKKRWAEFHKKEAK